MSISNILKENGPNTYDLESQSLTVSGTTPATDTQTGSLVISGGASFGNDVYVNGYVYSSGGGVAPTDALHLTGTVDSSGIDSGTLIVDGGAGVAKRVEVGGVTKILNTTVSNSPINGALVVSGGVGIVGKVNVGGDSYFNSDVSVSHTLEVKDGSDSTSISTGTLVIDGGAGISGNVNVGGAVVIKSTTSSTSTSTGALVVNGGMGVGPLNVGGNFQVSGTSMTKAIISTSTVDSSSESTGAIITVGGVGIGKSLNVNDNANFGKNVGVFNNFNVGGNSYFNGDLSVSYVITSNGGIESTSPSTGSLLIDGGAGITGNLYVGGSLNVAGSMSNTYTTFTSSWDYLDSLNNILASFNNLTTNVNMGFGSYTLMLPLVNDNIYSNVEGTYFRTTLPSAYIPHHNMSFLISVVNEKDTMETGYTCIGEANINSSTGVLLVIMLPVSGYHLHSIPVDQSITYVK